MTVITMQREGITYDDEHMQRVILERFKKGFKALSGKRHWSTLNILEGDFRESLDVCSKLVNIMDYSWWQDVDFSDDHVINKILRSGLDMYEDAYLNKLKLNRPIPDDLRLGSFMQGILDGALIWLDFKVLENKLVAFPRTQPKKTSTTEDLLIRKRLYVEITDKAVRDYLSRNSYEQNILLGSVTLCS